MIADNELDAAIRGVQRAGFAYVATMTFDAGGRTMMGESPEDAMRRIRVSEYRPIAFGADCGEILRIIRAAREVDAVV